ETATQQQLANLVRSNDLAGLQQVATRVNCDLPDAYGQTALMLAASRPGPDGSSPLVEFFVSSVGADVTCADLMGETSLHRVATEAGARILIEAGASVNAATKLVGLTPLMRAAMLDNNDDNDNNSSLENIDNQGDVVVRQLICLGDADWSRRDSFGGRAIDWARRMRRRKTVAYLSGELIQLNMEDPPAVKDGL
uniref:ANK_REP_REGION domain-containing protein n=1 Tax=Macrostomum lignano TaxID=282301 RepID=A0A1I8GLF8_9PLAT